MLFVAGCSTKKNTFFSRNIHALSTEYNVVYNGGEALKQGKDALIASYVDNYWEVLPVERMDIDEDVILPEQKTKNPHFEKAEEKATKAIQKHSMNIEGKEYNPQMDEAYLLLGKARYYDQRFIPALEAFNYVLYKYWMSDKVNETRIWRAKTNIRLENEALALKNLKRMLRLEELSSREYADAHAAMAHAYLNLKHRDSAVQQLNIAVRATNNNEEKGRYYYIIGQLYNSLGLKDSANAAFDNIIDLNRKTLRIYVINAHLEKIRNTGNAAVNDTLLLEYITALEEDYENNSFLDKIYREKAMFYAVRDSFQLMEHYLNKSLRAATTDRYLKAFNYEYLAQFRFDNSRYKDAGFYYDSTLLNLTKNSKKYRAIEKKRNNLNDVITYEDIARTTDSILRLVVMSTEEKQAYFNNHIQDLKAKATQKIEDAPQNQEQVAPLATPFPGSTRQNNVSFYFYNPVTLQYGRNEFRRVWGDRELEDNWRLADKNSIAPQTTEVTTTEETVAEDQYDVNYYLGKIPSEKNVIDSIKTERNTAYYQLGVLYKEKFSEYTLAIEKLEALLNNDPAKQLILPAKYNLYKIYEILRSPIADRVKNDIISTHPDSRYAAILKDPESILSDTIQTPEVLYTSLFRAFEAQEYETVITQAEDYIAQFSGDPVVPKFEMLKASAIGRLRGFEPYKEALNTIALDYPNDQEGKEADRMLKEDIKILSDKTFADSTAVSGWKLVFPMKRSDKKNTEKLLKTIVRSLAELRYDHLSVSKDIYDENQVFIVVHGFKSKDRTLGYAELLNINKSYKIRNKNFTILSDNYKIIQIHKNLEAYQKQKINP